MARIIYKLSQRQRTSGQAALLIRFYHGKKDFQAPSGIIVPIDVWDDEAQCLKVSKRFITPRTAELLDINKKIENQRNFILNSWLNSAPDILTRQWLIDTISSANGTSANHSKSITIQEAINNYLSYHNLANSVIDNYTLVAKRIGEISSSSGKTYFIDNFNNLDIADLQSYLTNKGISPNSVNTLLSKLHAVFKWLVDTEQLEKSPFDNFKIKRQVYGTPTYLTIEEREHLANFPFTIERDKVLRDIFIFQCHVGARYSDISTLTYDNIDNSNFLQYIQQKTHKTAPITIRVPLSKKALEIIERYKGKTKGNKLLPVQTLIGANRKLKGLFRRAGLDRPVVILDRRSGLSKTVRIYEIASTHLARRTFIANMYKEIRDSRIVSSFTGHSQGSIAFSRYINIDDDFKQRIIEDMDKLSDKNPT